MNFIDANPLDQLRMLVVYLIIAAAIVAILKLPKLKQLRRFFDRASNVSVPLMSDSLRFSDIGSDFAYEAAGADSTHEATIGARALGTSCVAMLAFLLFPGLAGAGGVLALVCLAVIGGYYLIYLWTYRAEITGNSLSVPTYHMTRKVYPLDQLVEVESDGAHLLRLRFSDGRRGEILRYVTGRQTLERRLRQLAERNSEG